MTRSDSFDLLRTWRLYTSMKMRSASSTGWPWRSTSAIDFEHCRRSSRYFARPVNPRATIATLYREPAPAMWVGISLAKIERGVRRADVVELRGYRDRRRRV